MYNTAMRLPLTIFTIILSVILIGLVLLQAKGTGLGRAFGSTAYHSRRGMEKLVFRGTIVIAVLFVAVSVAAQILIK